MTMQKLNFRGCSAPELLNRSVGLITFDSVSTEIRADYFFVVSRDMPRKSVNLDGYAAILVEQGAEGLLPDNVKTPVVGGLHGLAGISKDSIMVVSGRNSRIVYRPESKNNALFATGRCNSNCLMCSQPPSLDDDNQIVDEHLRIIDLIKVPPETLGITGGEPTLLGEGLVRILARLKEKFPNTHVQMLTNGRLYSYPDLVRELASVKHPSFISAIPLYADIANVHDYIVQARGAFDQTIAGLYNTARFNLQTEVRVVLHKQTIPRLLPLTDYIYRNLPFVSHVALMGLENMGYVKKNWDILWIDPLEYMEILQQAVTRLFYRGVNVSIYNLQLCLLPKEIWPFSAKSISDFKNIYLEECENCEVKNFCAGLFLSSKSKHSSGIHRLNASPEDVNRIFGNGK